jgi:chemotaxis protein methyltransferase CheR
VDEFCTSLRRDKDFVYQLKDFLTINVSEFFRDPAQFALLNSVVIPDILRHKSRLKVWSAGCSHGGEPYSIAMLLDQASTGTRHEIVATDLDDRILAKAKLGGPYSQSDVRAVMPGVVNEYFRKEGADFWVKDDIKKRVAFSKQNLLKDQFKSGFDLIICRNVVISFTDEAKTQLNGKFHDALRPGGWLFIGGTETLLGADTLGFERVRSSLYKKSEDRQARRKAA